MKHVAVVGSCLLAAILSIGSAVASPEGEQACRTLTEHLVMDKELTAQVISNLTALCNKEETACLAVLRHNEAADTPVPNLNCGKADYKFNKLVARPSASEAELACSDLAGNAQLDDGTLMNKNAKDWIAKCNTDKNRTRCRAVVLLLRNSKFPTLAPQLTCDK